MMDQRPIDLRVSTMPGKNGEKVVIRIIDNDRASVNLEKLGFGYETLKEWRKLISMPHGIVLVTGPTGSGKTTTLYAVLQELNHEDVNVCTVEDPVEYNLAGVNQFQVNEKTGFTYAVAMQSVLRQDPDVVMIGHLLAGRHFIDRVVGIGGEGFIPEHIGYYKIREGFPVQALIEGRLPKGHTRFISGDPLMGSKVEPEDFMGFNHYAFCAIPENTQREFLHFLRLGMDKYSFSKAYLSGLNPLSFFTIFTGSLCSLSM